MKRVGKAPNSRQNRCNAEVVGLVPWNEPAHAGERCAQDGACGDRRGNWMIGRG